jgi:hypothetical protein
MFSRFKTKPAAPATPAYLEDPSLPGVALQALLVQMGRTNRFTGAGEALPGWVSQMGVQMVVGLARAT